MTDAAWARRAGIAKETLSRVRGRLSCDFGTLASLAEAVGAGVTVVDRTRLPVSGDLDMPHTVDRAYEDRLLELCASGNRDPDHWTALGSRFFMAGLAVLVASAMGFDRRGFLALAEELHPGSAEPRVFGLWLARSPIKPSRFLSMLATEAGRAA